MNCEQIRDYLAGYQDGELDDTQKAMVADHLAQCESCRQELALLDRVKEVADSVKYDDLPLEVWDNYWHNIYRRVERGLGWIFFSLAAVIFIITGAVYLVRDFFLDATVGFFPKVGVGSLIVGGGFLLVSFARERIFAYNRERYRDVQR